MLRLGVCSPEQFVETPPSGLLPYLSYRLSRGRVSLRLLKCAEDHTFERLMHHVQLPNGVYRTTFRNRFRNLDPVVNRVLSGHFSSVEELVVEDWAASACLTSCEWAEDLLALFPRMRFTASDLLLFLVEVEDTRSGDVFIADQDGRLLQYVRPPFVVRMAPPESWQAPVNRLLYNSANQRWGKVARMWPLPDDWMDLRRNDVLCRGTLAFRKLPLVHPQALTLARADGRFSIRRQSIFQRAPAPCNVVRSMNILNRAYFSEAQLAHAAESVIESLCPGGIWILGRTIDDDQSIHAVSLLQKRSEGNLELIHRIGTGAEIESIVLSRAPATR